MNNRRTFLKKTALAGAGALLLPSIAKAAVHETAETNAAKIKLKQDAVILLQGDSITDAGRSRQSLEYNKMDQLGSGYPLFIASHLLNVHAEKQLKIYNRGISGNKVFQLQERWNTDAIDLKPDVISILIGVNDYWHTLDGGYKGTIEVYNNDLRALLDDTKKRLPNVQLVLGEPFILKGGTAIDESRWLPMFDEYRTALKKIAADYRAIFVPYQTAFDKALKVAPASYWAGDGVHPDLPGRQLMAATWLAATGLTK